MQPKTVSILFNHGPYGVSCSQEGIDLALICATFDCETQLYFNHDAVFLLKSQQNAERLQQKPFTAILAGLEFYDIQDVFVAENALSERGLTQDDLICACTLLSDAEFNQRLRQNQHIICF